MEDYKIGAGLVFAIFVMLCMVSLGFFIGFYWLISLLAGFKFSLIVPIIIWLVVLLLSIVVQIVGVKLLKGLLKQ